MKTKRGTKSPGTWFNPKLAVPFARWLDVDFAIWCDDQIESIIKGNHPHFDWKRLRHKSSFTHQLLMDTLVSVRKCLGKETMPHHFINETKMINWALSGKFVAIKRDELDLKQLDLLAKLESEDIRLLIKEVPYDDRKFILGDVAKHWLSEHPEVLLIAA